ncbi:uncharacterized protein LOC142353459 isoform X2 [Convolutriloba macropyga]|uniref:uncharacterized protein LOC142353459 isoform X2 n=2 Tax=Convolutriloba macropyga TaxID=536237 RepID=UPI003F5286EE
MENSKASAEFTRVARKNIDNFSLEDSLKRVEREAEISNKLQNTSNVISQDEQELMQQTIHDRFKSYPMFEKGQHRPPGSPPERLNVHPNYSRTERNWRDTEDKRSLETEANRPFYPTFGTSGGGAPLRDDEGNKITNLKSDPETRFQPHKDGTVITEKAYRYIADMGHTNEYIKELDEAVKEKQKQKLLEKEREEVLNAMHKRVDPFGQVGGGAPISMRGLDAHTGVDLHQGFHQNDPVYTDRSVVRHYDLQSYTRTGDKWNIPTRGSGNSNSGTATPMAAGGGGGSSQRQFGTEDHRLGFLPIGPEVHDDVRSRKDDHPFLQDTKRTPRHRASVEPFHPWGRPGAGAPLYQWQPPNPSPQLKTKVAGKFKQDFYNLDWEQNNDNRFDDGKRNYLSELKSDMVAHERRKQQVEEQQRKESALDLAEKIRQLDASGYPKRAMNGEVLGEPRNLSDISRHKLDVRYPNPLVAKSYHDFLSGQIQERDAIGHRQHQRDMQEKKQHTITMDSYFWKPDGHGAPYADRPHGHRRGKLGSQLHQGYPHEKSHLLSHSDLPPSSGTISQPHQSGDSGMSMGTQTEQYQLQAPFATSYVY